MDSEILRKLQLTQLEIAKDIQKLCQENDITYFLCAGSLLGAVRHEGFIPWDDDMDIGILYEDYDRFLQIAQEKLGDEYFVQTLDTDPYYIYGFCKIQKVGTEYVEAYAIESKKHSGIFVDVFPYFNYPDEVSVQRKQRFWIGLYRRILLCQSGMFNYTPKGNFLLRILDWFYYLLMKLLSKIISRKKAIQGYRKAINISNGKPSKARVAVGPGKYGTDIIPNACFDCFIDAKFEDTSFPIPKDYDTYLKIQYGDYMQFPPVEKRGNWHNIVRVKF